MRFGSMQRTAIVAALAVLCVSHGRLQAAGQWAVPQPASAFSVPTADLIQADELSKLLHARAADKPLILQVGSRVMFAQAHIPGSEYAGPGSQDAGLQLLRGRVASLPHKSFIVIYCGCCPWNRCPNVGPAYSLLHQMGFTHVKVLYMADNFGADWVNKGFAVESAR